MKKLFISLLLFGLSLVSCSKSSTADDYVPPPNYKFIQHYKLNNSTYIDEIEIDSVKYLVTVYLAAQGTTATTIRK